MERHDCGSKSCHLKGELEIINDCRVDLHEMLTKWLAKVGEITPDDEEDEIPEHREAVEGLMVILMEAFGEYNLRRKIREILGEDYDDDDEGGDDHVHIVDVRPISLN